MSLITTITQKGQITIPKTIRDILGLPLKSRVSLKVVNPKTGTVQIEKVPDILSLAGALNKYVPKEKRMDPVKAREYMETHYDGRI